jgi:DNA-binding transcriptional regulator YiaG
MTSDEIKEIRNRLGLTQEAFARLIDVSYQTVNRWETGAFKPSKLAIYKIEQLTKKQT